MAAELHMVGFRVGQQSYALPIVSVREIVRPPRGVSGEMGFGSTGCGEITAVPQSPAYVAGVMNLRGRILPVVDLRKRFAQPAEASSKNRVLVVSVEGKVMGLLVDAASEVLKIAPEAVEPSPKLFGENNERYVTGIARHLGRLVILLDAGRLLPESEVAEAAPA